MADSATTTDYSFWHMLIARREEFLHSLEGDPTNRALVVDQLAATEHCLLNAAAPDGSGTLLKLEILWAYELEGDDDVARCKRRILDELRNAFGTPTGETEHDPS